MINIGVLALQGAVQEHVKALQAPDVHVIVVKKPEQLKQLNGLVLPGGESTTMRRLMNKYYFYEPLIQFAKKGKPIFGTCAGAILMAKELVGYHEAHLKIMNIKVERNAFGRQRESFETNLQVKEVGSDIQSVFIRGPIIQEVGENVDVLAMYDGKIVVAKEGPLLACSFHPELTNDRRLHQFFVNMVKDSLISA